MKSIKSCFVRIMRTIALPAVIYIMLTALRPDIFLQWQTLTLVVAQTIPSAMIGWSMLSGMQAGLFDFSVGARLMLAGLVGINMAIHFGVIGFIIGIILASVVLAAITGAVYAVLRIPSIVVGFAGMLVFESVCVMYQNTFDTVVPDYIKLIGARPGIFIIAAVTFAIVYLVHNKTKFGYQIRAIGGNEAVAKNMGINSLKLKIMTFIVGGLFLGIATIVNISYRGMVIVELNMNSMFMIFTPMMGVIIGMFIKSCNNVIGVFIGSLTITIIGSGIVALGINTKLQNVIVGIFLLIFIGMQINSQRFDMKRRLSKRKKLAKNSGV